MTLGCDRHRAAPGAVPVISPLLCDPPPNLVRFVAPLSSFRDKTCWSQTCLAAEWSLRAESLRGGKWGQTWGEEEGGWSLRTKPDWFARARLMLGEELSLLRASSKPGRAGPQAVSPWPGHGGCKVSIPLRTVFASLEKNCFSLLLVPTFKESTEVIYQGNVCVC